MSIAIQCPGCQKNLKVKAEFAGRHVKCPACGNVIHIPMSREPLQSPPPRTDKGKLPLGFVGLTLVLVIPVLCACLVLALNLDGAVRLVLDVIVPALSLTAGLILCTVALIKRRNTVSATAGVVLGLLLVGLVGLSSAVGYNGRVNETNYNQLRKGMSLREVEGVLGPGNHIPMGPPNLINLNQYYEWESRTYWGQKRIHVTFLQHRVYDMSYHQAGW